MHTISDNEFGLFQRFIFEAAGITLSSAKKALVCGRLAKRLQVCNLGSYTEYFKLLTSGQAAAEVQTAVDLLTTNETYFFREPKAMFHGKVRPPLLDLANQDLVESHLSAVWLSCTEVPLNPSIAELLLLTDPERPLKQDLVRSLFGCF